MYLVLDIGGSSVKYAFIEDNWTTLSKDAFPTPKDGLDSLIKEIDKIVKRYPAQLTGIAISSPGAVNSKTGIIEGASAISYIHGPNIKQILSLRYNLPVEIENDANCAALAEIWQGAAKNVNDCCFVIIGTGIGGAIVRERKIHKGKNLHGGEFGFAISREINGRLLTFSDMASTRGLIEHVARRKSVPKDSLNGVDVFIMADDGDKEVIEEIQDYYYRLAVGLYNIQCIEDPEIIVLGGAISCRAGLLPELEKALDKIISKIEYPAVRPTLSVCQFNNDANLYGALYHFRSETRLTESTTALMQSC
ncbi:ROK family protein [Psychromonas aquimarina]|uniref:ROK family protein n=1 Tax=Psychromonas aquimarina TaxID=444919 RepID=UPI000415B801|nr:ROK family protein [Psychromonas aquimarina]